MHIHIYYVLKYKQVLVYICIKSQHLLQTRNRNVRKKHVAAYNNCVHTYSDQKSISVEEKRKILKAFIAHLKCLKSN